MRTTENEIETRLINIFTKIDMYIPDNLSEILSFIVEDIKQTTEAGKWTDKDIAQSLTRFIEKQ